MQNFMTVTIKHKMLTTQLLMLLLLAAFIFRIQLDSNPTEEFRQWTMHALSVPTMGYDNLMDSVSSLITYLLGKKKKAINNFLGCASSVAIATGPAMTQSSCGFLREATFSATRSHRNVTDAGPMLRMQASDLVTRLRNGRVSLTLRIDYWRRAKSMWCQLWLTSEHRRWHIWRYNEDRVQDHQKKKYYQCHKLITGIRQGQGLSKLSSLRFKNFLGHQVPQYGIKATLLHCT